MATVLLIARHPNQSDGVYPPWTGRVIATDFPGENVDIFSATGKPESQLTGFNGVKGLTLDASGSLYVIATSSLIFEYESDLATRSNVLSPNEVRRAAGANYRRRNFLARFPAPRSGAAPRVRAAR